MKHLLLSSLLFFFGAYITVAQDNTALEGNYKVPGYFFHPNTPREIDTIKTITQISGNRYQVTMADLGSSGYAFQFDVDNNNNLVNYTAVGSTPAVPASGFMDLDNPGNFSFPGPDLPGNTSYNFLSYQNIYDPSTHTFYMHYGYGVGSSGETGYSRQIYEKWRLYVPAEVHSFTPQSANPLTEVTVTGKGFTHTNPPYAVSFGHVPADSVIIESDTLLKAFVSFGATGKVRVINQDGTDSLDGFTFIPNPPITDSQWHYMGPAGFSSAGSSFVNMAHRKNNVPYVVYVDSSTGKAMVMKYSGTVWTTVGSPVSDGKCNNSNILVGSDNLPVIAYSDSTLDGRVTVKKFNGTVWTTVGVAGFAAWKSAYPLCLAVDRNNILYALSVDTSNDGYFHAPSVYKFNGTAWALVGQSHISDTYWDGVVMAVDTITGTPFIIFADAAQSATFTHQGEATVMKFDGNAWVYVGVPTFTHTYNGIFYPDIKFDATGVPYICFQEDDGFERASVYKLSGGTWIPVGSPKFSKGRSYYSSLTIDKNNNPLIVYQDQPLKEFGTIRSFNNISSAWDTLGVRGFCPSYTYYNNSLLVDTANIPMIAFSDYYHGGKVSVMMFSPIRNTSDSLCAGGNISYAADNNNGGNTYRWQVDAGTGFLNLSNTTIYSGVTTANLLITAVPSSYYGYKYRSIITNGGVSDTGAVHQLHFVNHWTGAVSSAWENIANWSCNELPDINTDVIINSGTVVVNSNVSIRSLQVNPGVSFTVNPGFNVIVVH